MLLSLSGIRTGTTAAQDRRTRQLNPQGLRKPPQSLIYILAVVPFGRRALPHGRKFEDSRCRKFCRCIVLFHEILRSTWVVVFRGFFGPGTRGHAPMSRPSGTL